MEETKGLTAEMYRAVVAVVDERVKEIKVTRQDFDELKSVVMELVQAQARTDASVKELVQAQARTDASVKELAQAQVRTDERVGRLEEIVEKLAQAQARTEEKLERLEAAVDRLVEAQAQLQKQVGALSDTVGYGLEDVAKTMLPAFLQNRYGIKLFGPPGEELWLNYFWVEGREVEINLYGEGERDGQKVIVLCESKSRIYRREVESFAQLMEQVEPLVKDKGEVLKVLFGYYIHHSAADAADERHILVVASYQRTLDLRFNRPPS